MALRVRGEGGAPLSRAGSDTERSGASEDGPGSLSSSSAEGRHSGSGLPAAFLLPPWKPPHQGAAAGRLSGTLSVFLEPEVF